MKIEICFSSSFLRKVFERINWCKLKSILYSHAYNEIEIQNPDHLEEIVAQQTKKNERNKTSLKRRDYLFYHHKPKKIGYISPKSNS